MHFLIQHLLHNTFAHTRWRVIKSIDDCLIGRSPQNTAPIRVYLLIILESGAPAARYRRARRLASSRFNESSVFGLQSRHRLTTHAGDIPSIFACSLIGAAGFPTAPSYIFAPAFLNVQDLNSSAEPLNFRDIAMTLSSAFGQL